MKKLSKKNQKIIADVKDTLEMSLFGLRKFHSEGRWEMVRHCQRSIEENLRGICYYLIHSDPHNWDKLKDAFQEIEDMHELSVAYYNEIDDDKLISEADYDKYIFRAKEVA